jgi:hypothetical protein
VTNPIDDLGERQFFFGILLQLIRITAEKKDQLVVIEAALRH